jgi:tetratricopeptide (TPR) repeat protein
MTHEDGEMIHFTHEWAQSKFRSALLLMSEGRSGTSQNRELAIHLFEEALRVFDRAPLSEEGLRCHYELGRLYNSRDIYVAQNDRLQALHHFRIVLSVCRKDEFPALWHATHLQLALIYKRESLESSNSLAKSSEDYHLRLAFAFDKERYPELLELLERIWSLNNRITELKRLIAEMEKGKEDSKKE